MKLHHFVTANVSEDGNRARQIGKALAPQVPPQPVTEVKLADIKKVEVKKAKTGETDEDLVQAMRDYAVDQLEGSTHSSLIHRKIRHYD